jgi:glycosyltransferase involved in cell wall biosynthesis
VHILLLATAWGSRHGGVNAFNRGLALGLAGRLSHGSVTCAVPEADPSAIEDAATLGIQLIGLEKDGRPLTTPEAWRDALASMEELVLPTIVVGHDVITGEAANLVATAMGVRSAFIHHMHYQAYLGFKAGPEHRVADKAALQRRVAEGADHAFAVGPLLAERLRPWRPNVETLIPGLEVADPSSSDTILSLTTFGRFDSDDLIIKQPQLVAEAFGRVKHSNPHTMALQSAELQVIGLDPNDLDFSAALKAEADAAAGRLVNILPLPFTEDARVLTNRLRHSNLVVAASLHEGFGLTAWEAIGAGAPVIVSKNSGVYRHIDETLEGQALGCLRAIDVQGAREAPYFREEDVVALADAIRSVAADVPRAKRDALKLRSMLLDAGRSTWAAAAKTFLDALSPTTPGPTALASANRFESTGSYNNGISECAELSVSTTQGSAAERFDVLAEVRFGKTEIAAGRTTYSVGVQRARLSMQLSGCAPLPGNRLGDRASDGDDVIAEPNLAWTINGPKEAGCLSRRVLGDEPLCAVKLDGSAGKATLNLTCRPRDLLITPIGAGDALVTSVNQRRVVELFLAKCLFRGDDDGTLSTAVLTVRDGE